VRLVIVLGWSDAVVVLIGWTALYEAKPAVFICRRAINVKEVIVKRIFEFLGIIALVAAIGFTMVSCGGSSFKERLDEAQADPVVKNWVSSYVSSNHSLQAFKKRLDEAQADPVVKDWVSSYVSSNHSLQVFKKRLDEAQADPVVKDWTRSYVSSNHSL